MTFYYCLFLIKIFNLFQKSKKIFISVIMWPSESERRDPEAEITWQHSSRTSPWSLLTSTITPHPVGHPFRAAVPSHPMHLTTYVLNSSLLTKLEGISGYGNYLYFVYLSRNKVIISRALLDGIEFKQSDGHNQICSSLYRRQTCHWY